MKRDTNYIIKKSFQKNSFSYQHSTGYIYLKLVDNKLSSNELLEYISDSLIHEHIHKILDETFNFTVSKLFDGIEHFFRNHALHEKQLKNSHLFSEHAHHKKRETYQTFIKRDGFDSFLIYYNITYNDIFYANKLCRDRKYNLNTDLNNAKNVTWKKLKQS